jgi:hypothetical protein
LTLGSIQAELVLVCRPPDDEAERRRLAALARVVRDQFDVLVGVRFTAGANLAQHNVHLLDRQIEQRRTPHLPVGAPRMGIVGVLDRHRPTSLERVLDLSRDLLVGEIR